MEIILKRFQANVKKPRHLQKMFFFTSHQGQLKIEPATWKRIDTEIIVFLPKNSIGFITSASKGDEISDFNNEQQRLWVEIFNKSHKETIEIKKNNPLGFVVIESEHLKFKHEAEITKDKKRKASLS